MPITFSQEQKDQLIKEIQAYFSEERDEQIGIIAAGKLLDFFLENLGNKIYNKALDDARVWFRQRIENLDLDYDLLYK